MATLDVSCFFIRLAADVSLDADGSYMGKGSYDLFTHRRGYINIPTE